MNCFGKGLAFFIARQARMKEVNAAKERQQQLIFEATERLTRYQELLVTYTAGGDEMIEKQVTFQREELYREIWEISLSKVTARYQVPSGKLKEACKKADIPLPTNKCWGDLSVGKPVTPTPLPDSSLTELTVVFKVRERERLPQAEKSPTKESAPDTYAQGTSLLPKHRDGKNLYEREVLYKEVWEQPVTKVAENYGVSDVMIHKVCKALNIPVPPRGYWAKKQAGQAVEIIPLPESNGKRSYWEAKIPTRLLLRNLLCRMADYHFWMKKNAQMLLQLPGICILTTMGISFIQCF